MPDSHDSPTFLGRESKLIWKLSFTQVLIALLIGFGWLAIGSAGPGEGALVKLLIYGSGFLLSTAILLYRIQGVTIPGYLGMMLSLQIRNRLFDSSAEEFCEGIEEWRLARGEEVQAAGLQVSAEMAALQRRGEAQARLELLVTSVALALKRFCGQVFALIIRGRTQ